MLIFIMISSLLFFSIMLMYSKHPLPAGLILIISTILVASSSALMMQMFWFSYILVLIFVGGMLILFIYLISLSPNQKFLISISMMFFSMATLTLMFIISTIDPLMLIEMSQKNMDNINVMLPNSIKLFNSISSTLTILAVNYLLLIMIIVTKITSSLKGPLRSNLKYV